MTEKVLVRLAYLVGTTIAFGVWQGPWAGLWWFGVMNVMKIGINDLRGES